MQSSQTEEEEREENYAGEQENTLRRSRKFPERRISVGFGYRPNSKLQNRKPPAQVLVGSVDRPHFSVLTCHRLIGRCRAVAIGPLRCSVFMFSPRHNASNRVVSDRHLLLQLSSSPLLSSPAVVVVSFSGDSIIV